MAEMSTKQPLALYQYHSTTKQYMAAFDRKGNIGFILSAVQQLGPYFAQNGPSRILVKSTEKSVDSERARPDCSNNKADLL